jgi:hypothetical protein
MPNVAAFYRDGLKADYYDIDRAICHHMDIPVNEEHWCLSWYGTIALLVALGKTLPEIVGILGPDSELYHVACFLSANYTTEAWYQHGWQ